MELNRGQSLEKDLMDARTDKRNNPRPKALIGMKAECFNLLEDARRETPMWYPSILENILNKLTQK